MALLVKMISSYLLRCNSVSQSKRSNNGYLSRYCRDIRRDTAHHDKGKYGTKVNCRVPTELVIRILTRQLMKFYLRRAQKQSCLYNCRASSSETYKILPRSGRNKVVSRRKYTQQHKHLSR